MAYCKQTIHMWSYPSIIYIHVQIWSLVDTSYMKLSRLPTKLRLTGTEYYRWYVKRNQINQASKKSRLTSYAQFVVSVLNTSCSPLVRDAVRHVQISHVIDAFYSENTYVLFLNEQLINILSCPSRQVWHYYNYKRKTCQWMV